MHQGRLLALFITVSIAPAAAQERPAPADPRRVVVRFACDDKYATPATCDEATWRQATLLNPTTGPDLLLHQDGGPGGAAWNGDAPLFVFVHASTGVVSLGGVKLAGTTAGEWRWFRVPRTQWAAALRGDAREPYRKAVVRVGKQPVGELWFAEGE